VKQKPAGSREDSRRRGPGEARCRQALIEGLDAEASWGTVRDLRLAARSCRVGGSAACRSRKLPVLASVARAADVKVIAAPCESRGVSRCVVARACAESAVAAHGEAMLKGESGRE